MNISSFDVAFDNIVSVFLSSLSTPYSPNTFVSDHFYSLGGSLPFTAFMPNPYILFLVLALFCSTVYFSSKTVLLTSLRSRHFFLAVFTIYSPRWIFYNSSLLIRFTLAGLFVLLFFAFASK